MYEVELKANITQNASEVSKRLSELAGTAPESEVYHDCYLDTKDRSLMSSDRELRIRTRTLTRDDSKKSILTYKDPPFDHDSKSKPEHETVIENPSTMMEILLGLEFEVDLQFEKRCDNVSVKHEGYTVEATIARIPEIAAVFVELEIQISSQEETDRAKQSLIRLLPQLGIPHDALTTEYYTDMVRRLSH